MSESNYLIHHCQIEPEGKGLWHGPAWGAAPSLEIDQFHARSSEHRPRTRAKLLYGKQCLYVLFDVEDRYVRCVMQGHQQQVCQDSCVEFFVQPLPGIGYFNFEVNCGGALLVYHVIDPSRRPEGGFKSFTVLPQSLLKQVAVYHALPARVEPEIIEPLRWQIELAIPWRFFEAVLGPITPSAGTCWRANFYKCADQTSHPHWATWAPIGPVLNFHDPERFGTLRFGAIQLQHD